MGDLPLRSLSINNFRRLAGNIQLELDAPIVLIHGPNGTGKTSILSALELALTGEVKSLQRVDKRYTAHLPYLGQSFATVGVSVAMADDDVRPANVITAAGNEIDGTPALDALLAQFYSERCYLDQVSLGRLLELYQHADPKKESSLARFVNELLGLDHLDALRDGLDAATHLARFKKFSPQYVQSLEQKEATETQLDDATADLASTETAIVETTQQLAAGLERLGLNRTTIDDTTDMAALTREVAKSSRGAEVTKAIRLRQQLAELRGRIDGLQSRSSSSPIEAAKAEHLETTTALEAWEKTHGTALADIEQRASALDIDGSRRLIDALTSELHRIDGQLADQDQMTRALSPAQEAIADLTRTVADLDQQIANSEGRAGSLATGLAALREHVTNDVCPVCDRDFTELSTGHLSAHLETKITAITDEGSLIRRLNQERSEALEQLSASQLSVQDLQSRIVPEAELGLVKSRRTMIDGLEGELRELTEALAEGARLRVSAQRSEQSLADLADLDSEHLAINELLRSVAVELAATAPDQSEDLESTWARLNDQAQQLELSSTEVQDAATTSQELITNLASLRAERLTQADKITTSARLKQQLQHQIDEAERRRQIARDVHAGATRTRDAIVTRVFTESLNKVWSDVFTRLAPNEPFTPRFGIPKSTTRALSVAIETVHRSGDKGGAPGAMLSAGNLNTAALSLFVALHLAVEPTFPCLLFDDPVQSMDEIHISQFAGLLRVLSKQHDRQIVVAVHERDLYQYLALELSPAYAGDELITIELGTGDAGQAVALTTRHQWKPDPAIKHDAQNAG